LTEKNMILVRQVISGGVWRRVINLPEALMAQARLLSDQSPVKAAVTAQLAVAIAILTNAPVRSSNLVQIRLDKNLIKPGGPDVPYMLVFTERVEKATGLFITVHQFRHAAAAIWLQYKPGDYERVRRILGHKRLQTTINFYCGLETLQANRDFGDLVRKLGAPQQDPPQPGNQP
jgi:integrase